jgi:hypothetical protein
MTYDVESPVVVRTFAAAIQGTMAEAFRLEKIRKILMPVFRLRQTSLVGPSGIESARGVHPKLGRRRHVA